MTNKQIRWRLQEDTDAIFVLEENDLPLASFYCNTESGRERARSTARLIAAAPQLVEALKAARRHIDQQAAPMRLTQPTELQQQIDAALAAAGASDA